VSATSIVVFDACVLYPAPLRSLLMYLAVTDLFQARWSEKIHEEWMRSVRRDYPDITEVKLQGVRQLMDAHIDNAIITGYEPLIDGLQLPDPDDRHVLAAAIHARANTIVTMNLADFPANVLESWNMQAIHPDEFVCRWLDREPALVCAAMKTHRTSLKNPPLGVLQYLSTLERQGLTKVVERLQLSQDEI
jgi:predicted nucleic acid-binding protein